MSYQTFNTTSSSSVICYRQMEVPWPNLLGVTLCVQKSIGIRIAGEFRPNWDGETLLSKGQQGQVQCALRSELMAVVVSFQPQQSESAVGMGPILSYSPATLPVSHLHYHPVNRRETQDEAAAWKERGRGEKFPGIGFAFICASQFGAGLQSGQTAPTPYTITMHQVLLSYTHSPPRKPKKVPIEWAIKSGDDCFHCRLSASGRVTLIPGGGAFTDD